MQISALFIKIIIVYNKNKLMKIVLETREQSKKFKNMRLKKSYFQIEFTRSVTWLQINTCQFKNL